MASQGLDEARIDDALKWAGSHEELIKNDYFDGYAELLGFFKQLNLENELPVIGAAYAVYGWMPTILKKEPKAKELAAFVRDLRKIKNDAGRKALALEQLEKRIDITRAVNNSTVGTSKFLHFVEPEIFPIWDSNVALAFEATSKINDKATYLTYCKVIHGYLEKNPNLNWPKELPDEVSAVRKMEFCLYAYGKGDQKASASRKLGGRRRLKGQPDQV